jgi:hypothetical protein
MRCECENEMRTKRQTMTNYAAENRHGGGVRRKSKTFMEKVFEK